jgi:hypothetical protein
MFITGERTKKTLEWPDRCRPCTDCGEMLPFSDFHKHSIGYMGYATKCKNCRKITSKKRYAETDRSFWLCASAKYRAKKKGIDFNIEPSDIIIQNDCPVLKRPYVRHTDMAPSVDRIDNNKGYIKGNIEVMSVRANRLKGDYTIEEINLLLEYIG